MKDDEIDMSKFDPTVTKAQVVEYRDFAREHLGADFHDISLLITALTHRSYVNEHRKVKIEHNERLEFLGDAVLELVVTDYIYRNFHQNEGVMTAWRSALVRTEANADAGEKIGYGPLVRLSHGEKDGLVARAHLTIMADCYEAVIGALYIDQGFDFVVNFINKHTICKLKKILEDESWRDPKSHLQELAQHYDGTIPQYHTLNVEGPDHDRVYTMALFIGDRKIGEATGRSKQQAQVELAKKGVEMYRAAGKTLRILDPDNL